MMFSAHPYLKLVYRELLRGDGDCVLIGDAVRLSLTALEFASAVQFDGEHASEAIRADAPAGVDIDSLLQRLASVGMLEAGRREPLPAPSQYGFSDGRSVGGRSARAGGPLVPSTFPGTLGGPSHSGSLIGLLGRNRGEAPALYLELNVQGLQPIGQFLNVLLFGRLSIMLLVSLTLAACIVMYNHRFQMALDLGRILEPVQTVLLVLIGAYLIDGLCKLARYAAVVRCTGTRPRFGLSLGGQGLPIPHFMTETGGAAEAADRVSRMRIVGSTLSALMMMFVLATLVWLTFHRQGGVVAPLAVGTMLVIAAFLIVQINPVGIRSGYQLLMQVLRVGDLREQAGFALFGRDLPWSSVQRLPTRVLLFYQALVMLYIVWVTVYLLSVPAVWLKHRVGPLGPLLVLGMVLYTIYSMVRRTYADQFKIGEKIDVSFSNRPLEWVSQNAKEIWHASVNWLKAHKPGPTGIKVIVIVLIICVLPYPYQPSGELVVLPDTRADVRAQVAGEVRQVFAKEGDLVKAGTVLAQLADEDEKAQLAAAQASLIRLQSNLSIGQAGRRPEEIDVARQAVNTAATSYQYAREEADRLDQAYKRKALSEQDYKRALSIAEVNQQKLLEARRQLTLVGSPTREDEIKGLEAEIEHQKQEIEYRQTVLGYTQVKAPIDGRILSGSLQFAVGDFMQLGAMLATVEDADHPQIEVKIPEDDLSEIKLGNKAWSKLWASPGGAYRGQVLSIAPSAEATQYGRVVRVYISVDKPDANLKPEMTGYAKIGGRWHLLIFAFTRPIVRLLFVEMWSWIP